jgi:competence protein ComEC
MSIALPLPQPTKPRGESASLGDQTPIFANAPAVWIAVAATVGIVVDRTHPTPVSFALALAGASLVAWLLTRSAHRHAPAFLLLTAAALGAAYHHGRIYDVADNDVSRFATANGAPAHVRGRLVVPVARVPGGDDPLQNIPRPDASRLVVDVRELVRAGETTSLSGRIVAYVAGKVSDVYPGDELEVHGRLHLPRGPGNPGELDAVRELRDQGIGAILSVPPAPEAIRLVASRWPSSISGWLGRLHGACKRTLDEHLTAEPALASALLLGDGSGLSRPEWDKFLKSGVVHALAISGQHLVVLAWFLGNLRRGLFLRLTPATIGIAAIIFGYALLTGGRPATMRAAWMVVVLGLATLVRRPVSFANSLTIGWLGVILVNPSDIAQTGCQLSFMAVAVLVWVVPRLMNRPANADPLGDLAKNSDQRWWRSPWQILRGRSPKDVLWGSYLVNAIVWLGVTPLVAQRYHVVSPIALFIGPLVLLATSIALASGLLLLLTSPLLGPLSAPFAWVTDGSLYVCETIIDWALLPPGASFALSDIPMFWLIVFYFGLLLAFSFPRRCTRWFAGAGAIWLVVGLMFGLGAFRNREFHVAFLSVGHGGCTVIVTSGGRVLVYDAGAITGPDVTRRIIVPYLRSRGLRHIDDLFISHADLDHYSGVPDLLDRISVHRVTLTPTFTDRITPGVRRVNADLKKRGIPTRVIKAGDGELVDDVKLDILHPPALGPDGKENARSLVMLVRKAPYAILLTGDLEDAGLEQVLALRPPPVDILMAPHHGSRLANPSALATWAKPKVAISSQGRPRGILSPAAVYEAVGAPYLTTFHDGAIEIDLRDGACKVRTFRTKKAIFIDPPPVR